MLYEFITLNREEIITRCRAKVATRSMPPPSEAEINHGVPLFLDQLLDMLRSGGTSTLAIDASAGQHGHDLLLKGFTVSQVVHDYGDVCQTVTDLALESDHDFLCARQDRGHRSCCCNRQLALGGPAD